MIDYTHWHQIRHLAENGLSATQIAQELALDPKTVRKWMARENPKK